LEITPRAERLFFLPFYSQQTMPATPRYKINDQVNKKRNTGVYLKIGSAIGTVVSMKVKTNKKGTPGYYYTVKWHEDRRTSEHAQHMLVPAP